MLCEECRRNPKNPKKVFKGEAYCDSCFVIEKECKRCGRSLRLIEFFAKNQHKKDQSRQRRSECVDCRKIRVGVKIDPKDKAAFLAKSPKPAIGSMFQCPICRYEFRVINGRMVNLDHNPNTGKVRGWLCNDCNTGMGKLKSPLSLARAIAWVLGDGNLGRRSEGGN